MFYFFSGLFVTLSLVAAVLFLRFWRDSRDQLFAKFAGAMLLLATERVMLVTTSNPSESGGYVYIFRLVAFLFIIWAMIEKNRAKNAAP